VCARRAVIRGAVAGPDGSEADDFSQVADRLEQRAAAGAQIADHVIRACRTVQARLARYAFEVGHQAAFARSHHGLYRKVKSRNASLTLVSRDGSPSWSFLTNHAQVLLCIAHDPEIRLREIGDAVGITERAAHRIVVELAAAGYIARKRNGRRNHYTIQSHLPLPDPLARKQKIGDLLAILAGQPSEPNG
jgi:MarR family